MLIISDTSSAVEVILNGAVSTSELEIYASWVDVLTSDQSVSAFDESDLTTNGGTLVTAVGAPLNNHTRTVKYLSVFNSDTAAATVTVRFYNGTSRRRLIKVTLQAGETLVYSD